MPPLDITPQPPPLRLDAASLAAIEDHARENLTVTAATALGLAGALRGAWEERDKFRSELAALVVVCANHGVEARRWINPSGATEYLATADEVTKRRREAATEIGRLIAEVERLKTIEGPYDLLLAHVGELMQARQNEWRENHRLECEVARLKGAVQAHHDQRGDDRCHLDDLKLYHDALGIVPDPYVTALPPAPDMEESCRRYIRQRQCPAVAGTYPMPGDMTIDQLTTENERLRKIAWGVVHNADRQFDRNEFSGRSLGFRVMEAVGCGSAMAYGICREFGRDPEEGLVAPNPARKYRPFW